MSKGRSNVFKLRDIVNVKDPVFGAKGDGTTDDTIAIQAAYNSLTSGGDVYFPRGTYKITGQITISYPIHTVGAGRGATIINVTTLGTNKAAFKAVSNNVSFSGFKLTGPSSAAYVAEEDGILFYGTSGAEKNYGFVRDVEINNFGAYGILAEYYNHVSVEGCYVHDIGYGGITGLSTDDFIVRGNRVKTITPGTASNAYGITVSNRAGEAVSVRFIFEGNTIDNIILWEGIDTHGGSDGTIANNVITNCKLGINVSPADGSNTPPHRIAITGNTIIKGSGPTSTHRGIGSGGYNGANKATGIVVTGNTIVDMGVTSTYVDGAVMFQFTQGLVFTGNSIIDSAGTALALQDGNLDFDISSNVISEVKAGHANASGIVINATGQVGTITGNLIKTIAGQYGIYTAATNSGISVFGNKITASGGIYVAAAFLGAGTEINASATFDPNNLVDGDGQTTTITVAGARLGDFAQASFSLDLQGIIVTAWVSLNDTVSVRFQNETGGAVDLASGTLRAKVIKV